MEIGDDRLVKKESWAIKKPLNNSLISTMNESTGTAYLYVHNEEDALDVFQEATYQAYISIHSLKQPEYFMTWPEGEKLEEIDVKAKEILNQF